MNNLYGFLQSVLLFASITLCDLLGKKKDPLSESHKVWINYGNWMDEAVHNHRMIDVHACTAECRNVKLVTLYLKRESKKDNQVEEGDSKSGS